MGSGANFRNMTQVSVNALLNPHARAKRCLRLREAACVWRVEQLANKVSVWDHSSDAWCSRYPGRERKLMEHGMDVQ